MQWAQTLDREIDEKLNYVSAWRKKAKETYPGRTEHCIRACPGCATLTSFAGASATAGVSGMAKPFVRHDSCRRIKSLTTISPCEGGEASRTSCESTLSVGGQNWLGPDPGFAPNPTLIISLK